MSPYAELSSIVASKNNQGRFSPLLSFCKIKHTGDSSWHILAIFAKHTEIPFYEMHSLTRLILNQRLSMGLLQ